MGLITGEIPQPTAAAPVIPKAPSLEASNPEPKQTEAAKAEEASDASGQCLLARGCINPHSAFISQSQGGPREAARKDRVTDGRRR